MKKHEDGAGKSWENSGYGAHLTWSENEHEGRQDENIKVS